MLAWVAANSTVPGAGLSGFPRRAKIVEPADAALRRRGPVTARPGASKIQPMTDTRIDVSIEQKGAAPSAGDARKHPNTCPSCGSHYRDDELD